MHNSIWGLGRLLVLILVVGWVLADGQTRVSADDPRLQQQGPWLLWQERPFTGVVLTRQPDGRPGIRRTPYVDGRIDGRVSVWSGDGQALSNQQYQAGQRHGPGRTWYADGRLASLSEWRHDVYDGEVKEWWPNGQLARQRHFVAGREEGLQQSWDNQGQLTASYVMRGGRRYGNAGSLACIDPAAAEAAVTP